MSKSDVIVVGGGIWGLACAYACAKRGQSVAVYEAGKVGPGVDGGGWNGLYRIAIGSRYLTG